MLRKLYFQIYLSIVGGIALLVLVIGLITILDDLDKDGIVEESVVIVDEILSIALDDPDFEKGKVSARTINNLDRLSRIHPEYQMRLSLYSSDGQLLAFSGSPKPLSFNNTEEPILLTDIYKLSNWRNFFYLNKPIRIELNNDRFLLAQKIKIEDHSAIPFLGFLVLAGFCIAAAAYPVTRRLTRSLEQLRQGVGFWGKGNINFRIPVKGCDEVSSLAKSFNNAASKIENLLQSHKLLLANASHELRSPLARIRLALELYEQKPTPILANEIRQNINELDNQIEEILLASKLDAQLDESQETSLIPVDFTALVVETASKYDIEVNIPDHLPPIILGNSRLLKIMVRNLLENAKRHGKPPFSIILSQKTDSVDAKLNTQKNWLVMQILDHGPGIPIDEREKIFTPFYRAKGSKEKEGSWGLGLSLVHQIVIRHNGTVSTITPNQESYTNGFEINLPI